MEHEDMRGYFQKLLPEEFLTYDDIVHWKFGPPEPHPALDARIGIGDYIRIMPFRPLQGLSRHRVPCYALLFFYSGAFTMRGDDWVQTITAGHTLFLAPDHFCTVDACGPDDYGIMLAMEPAVLLEHLELTDLPSFSDYLHLEEKPHVLAPDRPWLLFQNDRWPGTQWYIDELCCEHFEPDRRTYLAFPHLLQMIFIGLDRCVDSTARKRQPTTPLSIQTVLRYMKTNFADVSLNSTAERFGFSPNYLSHLLREYTGMGFQKLKQNECIAQAARLLRETEMTVAQIAQTVGIRNTTHFYSLFEARYGVTPSKYRKNAQKEAQQCI